MIHTQHAFCYLKFPFLLKTFGEYEGLTHGMMHLQLSVTATLAFGDYIPHFFSISEFTSQFFRLLEETFGVLRKSLACNGLFRRCVESLWLPNSAVLVEIRLANH